MYIGKGAFVIVLQRCLLAFFGASAVPYRPSSGSGCMGAWGGGCSGAQRRSRLRLPGLVRCAGQPRRCRQAAIPSRSVSRSCLWLLPQAAPGTQMQQSS